jgi:2-C-methyl-D-erythritol 2,4-cyclodiphosphate synthase
VLLGEVVRLVGESGFVISNVDATVALQQPKLLEHIQAIRERIAAILTVGVGQVSVKATTTERLGFVGDRSGASAYAVCTIEDGPARPRKL